MIRPGIYRDRDGNLVEVSRTATGLLLRYADGTTAAVSAR